MSAPDARTDWSPWRSIVAFGMVSLLADMVYEGARSVSGPLLASLGSSALLVGLITGAGEAAALVLRLFFGAMADHTGGYWRLTLLGYGLTAVSVPLLAVTPFIGAAGLSVACLLILSERTGKAIRSPSKSALLAIAAQGVGRGRGFGVHKALDQVGAFAGPLLVAAIVAATSRIWPAMAALAIPGIAAMALLVVVRTQLPGPDRVEPRLPAPRGSWLALNAGKGLPRSFFLFAAATGACTAGLVSYGLIGFHLVKDDVVSAAHVPIVYALAMASAALAALATGVMYDRRGGRLLLVLPLMVAAVPALVFSSSLAAVVVGVVVWGLAVGLQDSTVKALVADLVPAPRLATAYGVFAAIQGAAAVAGGAAAGYLYPRSLPLLVAVVAVVQASALVMLLFGDRSTTADASRSRTPGPDAAGDDDAVGDEAGQHPEQQTERDQI
ncbi:MFS transporter [Aeromicrobium sp.]|uniref:MFS transporter n=1 Tax=Aeromicrobium sp. TaxID=1871063 RepID=UPI00198DC1A4|nr:MFS transporter [Aeromicrobium sp.]MBC7631703.1 MFS transporter [Aeromicrobium sp.]